MKNAITHPPASRPQIVIMRPNDFDIICGWGKAAAMHLGNKRFQAIARNYVQQYGIAINKQDKAKVTCKVMDELLSSGCTRFLKKDPIFERFYVTSTKAAKDKVSHFLKKESTRLSRMGSRQKFSLRQLSGSTPELQQLYSDTSALVFDWKGCGVPNTSQSNGTTSLQMLDCKNDAMRVHNAPSQPFLSRTPKRSFPYGHTQMMDCSQLPRSCISVDSSCFEHNTSLALSSSTLPLNPASSESTPQLAHGCHHGVDSKISTSQRIASNQTERQESGTTPLERMCYDFGIFLQHSSQD